LKLRPARHWLYSFRPAGGEAAPELSLAGRSTRQCSSGQSGGCTAADCVPHTACCVESSTLCTARSVASRPMCSLKLCLVCGPQAAQWEARRPEVGRKEQGGAACGSGWAAGEEKCGCSLGCQLEPLLVRIGARFLGHFLGHFWSQLERIAELEDCAIGELQNWNWKEFFGREILEKNFREKLLL